ncbi:MAG: hypothetical protein AM325_015725 [Candidatus Thorarchaeota archaeon SMTZ1-45]
MLRMLLGQISKTRETRSIYKNRSAFYRSVNYLIESGLVRKKREDTSHLSIYELTLRGEMLARILLSLADIPPEIRRYQSIFRTDREIDMDAIP